jgi:hypothetical protein
LTGGIKGNGAFLSFKMKLKTPTVDGAFRAAFENACMLFQAPLISRGFVPTPIEVESSHGSQCFVAGVRYVKVSATVDPRDTPFSAAIALGEGDTGMPESDWNSVALRHVIEHVAPNDRATGAGSYPLRNIDEIPATFERMLADLLRFADDFLAGDLQQFRRIRAALVKTRSAYVIHTPDAAGRYSAREDPVSAALKQRFGRED